MTLLWGIVIAGTLMTFLRRDTAKRTLLAIVILLIGKYGSINLETKIALGFIGMFVWYWAVFGYCYLSERNVPIRKYL